MKTKILAVIIVLCLITTFITPAVGAAGTVYFAGVNDVLIPLNDQTIPRYFGGELYVPYTIFTYEPENTKIGFYCIASSTQVMLYTKEKQLWFDVAAGTIYDQDGTFYYQSARTGYGTIYLPLQLVCEFFGVTYSIIDAEPATIIRVKNSAAIYNNPTFAGIYKTDMLSDYNAYLGIEPSSEPTGPPSPHGPDETYEDATVYLSFYDINAGQFALLLDIMDMSEFKCAIFVSGFEIAENADLIRRAAGAGHTIGIWLEEGSYDEYQATSNLLFEAAKIKTFFVSAGDDARQTAEETADANNLIYCHATSIYGESTELSLEAIEGSLSVVGMGSESLSFSCSEKISAVMPALLTYLEEHKFNVSRITETSIPPNTAA